MGNQCNRIANASNQGIYVFCCDYPEKIRETNKRLKKGVHPSTLGFVRVEKATFADFRPKTQGYQICFSIVIDDSKFTSICDSRVEEVDGNLIIDENNTIIKAKKFSTWIDTKEKNHHPDPALKHKLSQ